MTTQRDYYDILGVERGATDADLKKAFRKLAQQWHPDVNRDEGADERFKEINEAYQVLSDPQRRQAYDMFGRAGVGGGGFDPGAQPGFGAFSDLFDAFFGGSAAGGGVRRGRPAVGSDLRYDLRITFEESIRGTEKEIEFAAPRPLRHLLRQRGEERDRHPGLPPVRRPRRDPPRPPDDARPDGQRHRLPPLPRRGQDRRVAVRGVQRRGPAGSGRSGSAWRCPPASTTVTRSASRPRARSGPRGGPPGSLYVAIHVAPHPHLRREGTELYHELDLSIAQAALGTTVRVPTADGEEELEIKPGHPAGDGDPPARPRSAASAASRCARATSTSSWT